MAYCYFCDKTDVKLIKAHIIPAGFFKRTDDGSGPLRMLSSDPESYPKKVPLGPYDGEIICEGCEPIFGPWDNHAQKILNNEFLDEFLAIDTVTGKKEAYVVPADQYGYQDLKLFFISLLWRAAISSLSSFSEIEIGPFQEIAKALLKGKDPGDAETFGVILQKYEHPLAVVPMSPCRSRLNGRLNYCTFFFGGFKIFIKVDKRKTDPAISPLLMTPGQPLAILTTDWVGSKECRAIIDLATAPQNRKIAELGRRSTQKA